MQVFATTVTPSVLYSGKYISIMVSLRPLCGYLIPSLIGVVDDAIKIALVVEWLKAEGAILPAVWYLAL
jgi:hypothetical protein